TGSVLYFHSLPNQETLENEIEFDINEFNNYSIEACLEILYTENLTPKVRGWFYKGDFGVPETVEGRFFTPEEVKTVSNYAVVGKNAYEGFGYERNGKKYISYRDYEYEIIGIVGREGHETSVDDWVFITLPTALTRYGGLAGRPIIADAESELLQRQITDHLKSYADGVYSVLEQPVSARIDIGISKDIIDIFIAVIFITAVVFCIYFTDKLKQIINIKKFIGYSVTMIITDTSVLFISISAAAYLVGNLLMYAVSKTILFNIPLFSVFSIDINVLLFSFGALILIAFFFAVLAVFRSFSGTARDLKRA
ncbi:MAG: ABC transporter permease, partial [Clostridia bacterium]|nr:ABC transporter permease [Clostridia bacterium]